MIAYWFRRGLLVGHQRKPQTPLWVRLTDEDRLRLDGSATLEPDMVHLSDAPEVLKITEEQMHREIRAGHLLTYRLMVKNRWRWYVQLPAQQPTLTTKP
jgi:hypothetical protein